MTASEAANADLFWALRGGSRDFGAVTSFEFRLHPVDMVHVGLIFYDAALGADIGASYREWLADQPEEMGAFLGFHQGPPVPVPPGGVARQAGRSGCRHVDGRRRRRIGPLGQPLLPIDSAVQRVAPDATAFPYRDVWFVPCSGSSGRCRGPADGRRTHVLIEGGGPELSRPGFWHSYLLCLPSVLGSHAERGPFYLTCA